jgi:hypothetical protein
MKALTAAVFALAMSTGAVFSAGAANAATVNVRVGVHAPVHHRHKVCYVRRHHRVCVWR